MATNHSGSATSALPPSPAPSPGSVPVVSVPDDGDPLNAASVAQALKANADQGAYIQKAVKLSPPIVTGANAIGFTNVSQVGSGSATVTPTGANYGGLSVILSIVAGGATGTATCKYSLDGGATYSSTVSTASTLALASSGITLSLSGTFVAATTYSFRSVFTPLALFSDSAGIGRFLVDRSGIDTGGRITRVEENYDVQTASYVNASPFTNYPKLLFSRVGSTYNYITGMFLGQRTCGMETGANATGDSGYVASNSYYLAFGSGSLAKSIYTMEVDVYFNGGSSDIFTGFNDQTGLAQNANNCIGIRAQLASSSVWHFITKAGGVSTDIATTVTIALGSWTRVKFEFHESGTALAIALSASSGVMLVIINDVLAAVSKTNIPTASMVWTFGSEAPSIHLAETYYWSTWSWRVARNQVSNVV